MRRRRATVQWRQLVNGNVAAERSGEWAQHFSNASCLAKRVVRRVEAAIRKIFKQIFEDCRYIRSRVGLHAIAQLKTGFDF